MNRLTEEKRIQIVSALVEGNSLRATARMCDMEAGITDHVWTVEEMLTVIA